MKSSTSCDALACEFSPTSPGGIARNSLSVFARLLHSLLLEQQLPGPFPPAPAWGGRSAPLRLTVLGTNDTVHYGRTECEYWNVSTARR